MTLPTYMQQKDMARGKTRRCTNCGAPIAEHNRLDVSSDELARIAGPDADWCQDCWNWHWDNLDDGWGEEE